MDALHLLSVALEDRIPAGYSCERSEVVDDPEQAALAAKVALQPSVDGCVAFLFGRLADGTSVCLRQEGVRPRLYYRLADGESAAQLKRELEPLVASELRRTGGLVAAERTFHHGYGFEPDPRAPLERRTHRYADVGFPNLASFRRMRQVQREDELADVRARAAGYAARLAELRRGLDEAVRRDMRGLARAAEADGGADEAERRFIETHALPSLRAREAQLKDDRAAPAGAAAAAAAAAPAAARRPARYPQEHFVEPLTRFLQEEDLHPGRWYSFPVDRPCDVPVTLCGREYDVDRGALRPVDRGDMCPYVTCYYDIETTSLEPETHPVIQVSLVFEHAAGRLDRHVVALGGVSQALLPGIACHVCNTEAEVLATFARLVREHDPDFVVAYNGVNFDNRFLDVRAAPGRASPGGVASFHYLSRFALRRVRLCELRLVLKGCDNVFRYFPMAGRSNFDWFVKLKNDLTSEDSYSLNHFARTICGDAKKDMDHREIPKLQAGSDDDRARLAEYCVHDSVLLARLNQARAMVVEIVQFASVFGILPEWVGFRGQLVRFVSQFLRRVRADAVPTLLNVPEGGFVDALLYGKFTGATVNDPEVGFFKRPVVTLDWLSLYPSVMIGHNLCYTTHVPRERIPELVRDGWAVRPPSTPSDDPRLIVAHDIGEGRTAHFVASRVRRGVLPAILQELAANRKAEKARCKERARLAQAADAAGDAAARDAHRAMASVHDKRQLAMKTAMNSVYGACGADKYPNVDISSTVTANGRHAMVVKKQILPGAFPTGHIIYGDTDSIMMCFDDVRTVGEAAERGNAIADFITRHFAVNLGLPTMVMEFEKVYHPYVQLKKKRYAGLKYEPGSDGALVCKGLDCKGIETERKDTLPFTRALMGEVLEVLMRQVDEHAALRVFERHMERMVRDEVPFEEYIMKKNLSAKVVGRTDSIVQAKVNHDRRQREPGSEAATGEQVEYVIVNGHRKEKATQLAQDPAYARAQGLRPNRLWYFEHAVEEPLGKIFRAVADVQFGRVCDRYRAQLDASRLNVGDGLRRMLVARGGAGSDDESAAARPAGHVPRPLAPRRKRPKGTGGAL